MDPHVNLKRKAMLLLLGVAFLGALIAICLHSFETEPHFVNQIIPLLSALTTFILLRILIQYPERLEQVTYFSTLWAASILLFPTYFFVLEATLDPNIQLVNTFPPITSTFFLLTTGIIVFLKPKKGLIRVVLFLWVIIAGPILLYFCLHLDELQIARGRDLVMSLGPGMGCNFCFVLFYVRLQEALEELRIERLHLKEISEKDALTGIFNRGAGERILENLMLQSNVQLGIILCDIDHFKRINDTYGHRVGDQVLQTFAHRFQSILLPKHTLVRWGGEEFLIIVPGEHEGEVMQQAERLRQSLADQDIAEVGQVTASFGVAYVYPEDTVEVLFEQADRALYQAKNQGRNQVVLTVRNFSSQTSLVKHL